MMYRTRCAIGAFHTFFALLIKHTYEKQTCQEIERSISKHF